MTLFFIHLPDRSDPKLIPRRQFPLNQWDLEQEGDRHRQQALKHLREVRTDYSLERRSFL